VGAIIGRWAPAWVLMVTGRNPEQASASLIALSAVAAALTLVRRWCAPRAPRLRLGDAIWTLAIVALAVLVGRNLARFGPCCRHGRFSAVERNTILSSPEKA